MEFGFDCATVGTAGAVAEAVGEVVLHSIERPTETSGRAIAGAADKGTELWLVSTKSFPVCAKEFAFSCGTAGAVGGAAEAVGEAASNCIERPKGTSASVTAGIATTICCAAP